MHKDLIDRDLKMRQQLSSTELALFNRYVRMTGYPSWRDAVLRTAVPTVLGAIRSPDRTFPLVLIGGYLQTGVNVAIPGDMTDAVSNSNLDFGTVQKSLQWGSPIDGAPRTLVPDFNAETNVITALICHADGKHPARVCNRTVIRSILKHVK